MKCVINLQYGSITQYLQRCEAELAGDGDPLYNDYARVRTVLIYNLIKLTAYL